MGTFGPVNEEQTDYLNKSLTSGKHLLSLINDVLDVAKLQSGMMKLFVEQDFDIRKEVVEIAAATKPDAARQAGQAGDGDRRRLPADGVR
jgi:signal transduction histidine kinase